MRTEQFTVPFEAEGMRIDKYAGNLVGNASRSYVQRLIKEANVSVNGLRVKPSYQLKEGDVLIFSIPEAVLPEILPEEIPLDILYEDRDVIVVNKPKGMVVHPAAGHYSGTLVNALLYHCREELSGINGIMRPGIVHRIDKDTTGSVIACKNDAAHRSIADQLKAHTIKRLYRAIVEGVIKEEEGTVDAPIGRHLKDRKKMAVVPGGKRAVTHFRVLRRYERHTYIECGLETGRTHQIRVHMAYTGHPVLGDPVYSAGRSSFKLDGQTLHAMYLGFLHPSTEKYIETVAPLPDYFTRLLEIL